MISGRAMSDSPRALTLKAIKFQNPHRIPLCLYFNSNALNGPIGARVLEELDSDMQVVFCDDPEWAPEEEGLTQWGYRFETMGETMGEVKDCPLKDWGELGHWLEKAPDFSIRRRYGLARETRAGNPDIFLIGGLGFMMMEIFNLRGLAEFMTDLYLERGNLDKVIDYIYAQARHAVDGFADAGMDAVIAWEDWGLQDRVMVNPEKWREVFFARMKDFIDYVHGRGMCYILHCCGYILDYLDYFVEMGVDVIQMDQQMNMGLDRLSGWRGKICFFNPVDIQFSPGMSEAEIAEYARRMAGTLGTENGGFMYKAYSQPAAIHMPAANIISEARAFQGAKGAV